MSAHLRHRNRDLVVRTAFLTIAAGLAPLALGDVATWSGGAGDLYWPSSGNWTSHAVPSGSTDVTFSTSLASGSTIAIAGSNAYDPGFESVNSLTFNTATSFTLGDAYCAIGMTTGNLTRSATSSGTQTISSGIDLYTTNAFTWNVGGAGRWWSWGRSSGTRTTTRTARSTRRGRGRWC